MNTHPTFIINLQTHPQGYTFHSLQEHNNLPKPKKHKLPPPKPTHNKITNRLIKEIGLNSEIPPIIPEEHQYSRQLPNPIEEVPKPDLELQQEEQIDCQAKRQTPLPNSPAQWFSLQELHPKEIEHFPEFFTGKNYKTPELYQAYRNFIVENYRNNPKRYLTFVACRRVMKGDVNCLLKIYQFLVNQGIINYTLGPDGNYDFKAMSLAQASQLGKKPQSCLKKIPDKPELEQTSELDTDNVTVTVINKNFSRSYRVYCQNCKLICGVVWYAQETQSDQPNKILCPQCYNSMSRQQTQGYVKSDITKKIETNKQNRNKTNWGLDDNVKLLDFMGSCKNKEWSDVQNQFQGKKNVEDIILQFMQFPITNFDPYQHQTQLQHQKKEYQHQEYIQLLDDLYSASEYAVKEEQQEQKEDSNPPPTLDKFKSINALLLSKINNKIQQLKIIETVCQETNIDIREKPLVTRVKSSKAEPNAVYSDNSNNQEDDNQ